MNSLLSLTSRNLKIFYRTKGNLFFSMLSVLILVVLHFIVFRSTSADSWSEICSQFPGLTVERSDLLWLNDSLMFAAILPIGAVTISLVSLSLMTSDREKNTINDFLVSPIKRNTVLASYLISSFITGFGICIIFIVFFSIYFMALYGVLFTMMQMVWLLIATIGSLIFANVFMLLIISFIKNQQTVGAVGTVVGTGIGFLSGAYIPIGMFGETIGNIFSSLPFLQLTVLMRQVFLMEMETVTPLRFSMISGDMARNFGIELFIGGKNIPIWGIALFSLGISAILLGSLIFRFNHMKKAE